MNNLNEIAQKFHLKGTISEIKPLGNGLINDTLRIKNGTPGEPDYVMQRINTDIFPDVEMLQNNIGAVTRHIRKKLEEAGEQDIDRKVLHFVETDSGKTYYKDEEGKFWRVMVFIDHAKTFETVNPEYSYFAGKAFGDFEAKLADIPDELGEVIPNFHNMEFRMQQLHEAVANDAAGRVASVQNMLDEIEKNSEEMCKAERLYREGKLPKRICHCDTKVNNMMFDDEGRVLCVIDLDTVMPSYVFSDFGDFLRTAANTVAEDDKNIDKVDFRMDIFEAFARGYLEGTASFLTPIERENLPYAACLFPFMQCVRFLADYINGDTYYKIQYPEHNLVRANNQFRLWQRATEKTPEMADFIAKQG